LSSGIGTPGSYALVKKSASKRQMVQLYVALGGMMC